MRTIKVELEFPVDKIDGGQIHVSTEVIVADDDPESAREAGREATLAIAAFMDGWGGG